jgi:hypothetical protein
VLGSPCSSKSVAYYQKAIWLDVTWHAGPIPWMSCMLCIIGRRRLLWPRTSDTTVSLLRSIHPEMLCCDADDVTSAHPQTWDLESIATVSSMERNGFSAFVRFACLDVAQDRGASARFVLDWLRKDLGAMESSRG